MKEIAYKKVEENRCNDPDCGVLNPNKSALKEDLVWELLDRIFCLPAYYRTLNELLFELGRLYAEFSAKKIDSERKDLYIDD